MPVSLSQYASSTTALDERHHATETAVAPALAGQPTVAEIQAYVTANTIRNTLVYYTGNDTPTDPITYAYDADNSSVVTPVEVPGGTDDLGNHIATQNLDLANFDIRNATFDIVDMFSNRTEAPRSGSWYNMIGATPLTLTVNIAAANNTYFWAFNRGTAVMTVASGTAAITDAGTLQPGEVALVIMTGTAVGNMYLLNAGGTDDLGNHIATQSLNMAGFAILSDAVDLQDTPIATLSISGTSSGQTLRHTGTGSTWTIDVDASTSTGAGYFHIGNIGTGDITVVAGAGLTLTGETVVQPGEHGLVLWDAAGTGARLYIFNREESVYGPNVGLPAGGTVDWDWTTDGRNAGVTSALAAETVNAPTGLTAGDAAVMILSTTNATETVYTFDPAYLDRDGNAIGAVTVPNGEIKAIEFFTGDGTSVGSPTYPISAGGSFVAEIHDPANDPLTTDQEEPGTIWINDTSGAGFISTIDVPGAGDNINTVTANGGSINIESQERWSSFTTTSGGDVTSIQARITTGGSTEITARIRLGVGDTGTLIGTAIYAATGVHTQADVLFAISGTITLLPATQYSITLVRSGIPVSASWELANADVLPGESSEIGGAIDQNFVIQTLPAGTGTTWYPLANLDPQTLTYGELILSAATGNPAAGNVIGGTWTATTNSLPQTIVQFGSSPAFNLLAGRTYRLEGQAEFVSIGQNEYGATQWRDTTNAVYIGQRGIGHFYNFAAGTASQQATTPAVAIIKPVTDITVRLFMPTSTGTFNIASGVSSGTIVRAIEMANY